MAKRVCLIIGNADYPIPLLNPVNDAKSISAIFKRLGFSGIRRTPDSAGFELSDSGEFVANVTCAEYRKLMSVFGIAAEGAEQAIIYFAGHGVEDERKNFLIPIDAVLGGPSDLPGNAIALTDILPHFSKCSFGMVVLDACRDNPLVRSWARSISGYTGLAPIEVNRKDLIIAYAAREGQQALDGGPNEENSPYARGLEKYLEWPNKDILHVLQHVTRHVKDVTGGKQEPWQYGSSGDVHQLLKIDVGKKKGDFYLARSRNEGEKALLIEEHLENNGFAIVNPIKDDGTLREKGVQDGVENADLVVGLYSEGSIKDADVVKAITIAATNKRLLSILLTAPGEDFDKSIPYCDLSNWSKGFSDSRLDQVLKLAENAIGQLKYLKKDENAALKRDRRATATAAFDQLKKTAPKNIEAMQAMRTEYALEFATLGAEIKSHIDTLESETFEAVFKSRDREKIVEFIRNFEGGRLLPQASSLLKEVDEDAAFNAACKEGSSDGWKAFLIQHPDGRRREEAGKNKQQIEQSERKRTRPQRTTIAFFLVMIAIIGLAIALHLQSGGSKVAVTTSELKAGEEISSVDYPNASAHAEARTRERGVQLAVAVNESRRAIEDMVTNAEGEKDLIEILMKHPQAYVYVGERMKKLGYIEVPTGAGWEEITKWRRPGDGEQFRDCDNCPEMVLIPAGSYWMGSLKSELGRRNNEDNGAGARVHVTIKLPLAVSRFEINVSQFAKFVKTTGYMVGGCDSDREFASNKDERSRGWQNIGPYAAALKPVVCVSWLDATAYARWLRESTGLEYRLLSEAEWEYAARARTNTAFAFGNEIDKTKVVHGNGNINTTDFEKSAFDAYRLMTDSNAIGKSVNAWGLAHMHGNAAEWVEDCYTENYANLSEIVWMKGHSRNGTCESGNRTVRGGSWLSSGSEVRSAARIEMKDSSRKNWIGFRVVRGISN
jgi:formylglycine-generating enzyme required for sulfatase activity